jgi:hypothetical protein
MSKKELVIFSPYFVPGKKGTASLVRVGRAWRARAHPDQLTWHPTMWAWCIPAMPNTARHLLRGGVELYEMNKKLTREQRKEKKGTRRFIQGQPARQILRLRSSTGVYRLIEPRSTGGGPQHRNRRGDRIDRRSARIWPPFSNKPSSRRRPSGWSWSRTPMDPRGSDGTGKSMGSPKPSMVDPYTLVSGVGSALVSWACCPLNRSFSAFLEKDAGSDAGNDRSDITLVLDLEQSKTDDQIF